ncbi:hypothetical protein [Quadrisphaera sp. INWT6]|uniref:hypothetical protein n=1 Tax=Quadrisphaera sp. INWT6 TaxID=2596917 RepID=UPI0018924682|nr:hypothetical protein [Quadrisphaera sp. INWT6]MBF5080319.1 hypothetical protein [Quadrisphaera sp. INWT6]
MDIWLVAVLVAWIPVAALLALLVGRTVAQSEARERLVTRRLRAGDPVPVVVPRQVHAHAAARRHLAS